MRNSTWSRATRIGMLLLLVGMVVQLPARAEGTPETPDEPSEASREGSQRDRNQFKGIIGWSHKFEEHEYLLRAGLGYEFEPKGLLVSPYAWVDFVEGHKIYFVGVGIGKGF